MSAPELSEYERGGVARFGIFAEEERVERVARAIVAAAYFAEEPDFIWKNMSESLHDDYRRLAVAAIEALAPADEMGAIERVSALADEYERHAGLMQAEIDSGGPLDVVMRSQAFRDAAASIRTALAGVER